MKPYKNVTTLFRNKLDPGLSKGSKDAQRFAFLAEVARQREHLNRYWLRNIARHLDCPTEIIEFKKNRITVKAYGVEQAESLSLESDYLLSLLKKSKSALVRSVRAIHFVEESFLPEETNLEVRVKPKDVVPPFAVDSPLGGQLARIYKLTLARGELLKERGYNKCGKCHSFYKESRCGFCYNRSRFRMRDILHNSPWLALSEILPQIDTADLLYSEKIDKTEKTDKAGENHILMLYKTMKEGLKTDYLSHLRRTISFLERYLKHPGNFQKTRGLKSGDEALLSAVEDSFTDLRNLVMLNDCLDARNLTNDDLLRYPFPTGSVYSRSLRVLARMGDLE